MHNIFLYLLYLLRVLVVLIPQYGYIHPDEFHQFTEPMARTYLDVKTIKVWEFNDEQPIRSMFFPQITVGLLFRYFRYYFQNNFQSLSSYLVLIIPRILMV